MYGGIEAGGTKLVCAVGTGPDDLSVETTIATALPEETIGRAVEFFRRQPAPVTAIGIGSFGPVDPHPHSPTYGYITTTPKPGWANTDFAGAVQRGLGVPVVFDTDVNAAALGEHRWGAAQELDSFIYLTVGTGIGGGGMMNGRLIHGLLHPEMGHVRVPHDLQADPYDGHCPFHQDCLEGLACAPAIQDRWGKSPETLPAGHPAWALEARYLALGAVNFICTVSPQRVIIGGGIMQHPGLLSMVRASVQELLNGYIQAPQVQEDIDQYIVPPALGQRAGILGAIALAQQADGR